jgi:transaldolase/glucose-6-phosphate isomerase
VESSKKITKAKIADYQKSGQLDEGKPAWTGVEGSVFSSAAVSGQSLAEILKNFLADAKPNGYVAINAYLPRNEDYIKVLQDIRVAIRAKTGNAVTAGFGPRFQHSTGQFHKGGIKDSLFLVITADPIADFEIPTEGLTFGTLIRSQALGDYEALLQAGKRALRIHFNNIEEVKELPSLLA